MCFNCDELWAGWGLPFLGSSSLVVVEPWHGHKGATSPFLSLYSPGSPNQCFPQVQGRWNEAACPFPSSKGGREFWAM